MADRVDREVHGLAVRLLVVVHPVREHHARRRGGGAKRAGRREELGDMWLHKVLLYYKMGEKKEKS